MFKREIVIIRGMVSRLLTTNHTCREIEDETLGMSPSPPKLKFKNKLKYSLLNLFRIFSFYPSIVHLKHFEISPNTALNTVKVFKHVFKAPIGKNVTYPLVFNKINH